MLHKYQFIGQPANPSESGHSFRKHTKCTYQVAISLNKFIRLVKSKEDAVHHVLLPRHK